MLPCLSLLVPQAGQDTRSFQLLINCARNTQQFLISVRKRRGAFQTRLVFFSTKLQTLFRPENPYPCSPCSPSVPGEGAEGGGRAQVPSPPGRWRRRSRRPPRRTPQPRTPSPPPQTPGSDGGLQPPDWLHLGNGRSRGGKGRVVAPSPAAAPGPRRARPRLPPPRSRGGRALLPLTRRWWWWWWAAGGGAAPRPRGSRLPRPPPPRGPWAPPLPRPPPPPRPWLSQPPPSLAASAALSAPPGRRRPCRPPSLRGRLPPRSACMAGLRPSPAPPAAQPACAAPVPAYSRKEAARRGREREMAAPAPSAAPPACGDGGSAAAAQRGPRGPARSGVQASAVGPASPAERTCGQPRSSWGETAPAPREHLSGYPLQISQGVGNKWLSTCISNKRKCI